MIEYSTKHKITDWLFAGDWFEKQEDEKYDIINQSWELINKVKENEITIHAIRGNHDRVSWKLLKKIGISFIPTGHYIHPEGNFELGHYVPKEIPYFGDKTKPMKSLDKKKIYFLGHWHQPSQLNQKNLYFLGSLIPDKYGNPDEIYRCGFIYFNTQDLSIKQIPSNIEGKFTLNVKNWLQAIENKIVKPNDYIRILCKNQKEIEMAEATIKELNIKTAKIFPVFDKKTKKINKQNNKIPSIRDLIEKHGKENELDTKIPLDTLKGLGH